MCWYQTSRLSSPQSHTCLTAKQAHHQNFICSAKTFLTSSFQWYILVQAPSGHLKAKCGSWECSMGQRKGVGSVPRRVGKAWLRQQGPKQAGLCFSFLWGSTKQKVEPWAIPATSQNQDIASTSKSPCQHLPQHLTTWGTSSSDKNRDLLCGSTFTSEFFPPGPPAHLLLGKGGSREQLNTLAGGAGEKGGAGLWEEQGSSKSWLQQTMSQFNLNLTASHIRKAGCWKAGEERGLERNTFVEKAL